MNKQRFLHIVLAAFIHCLYGIMVHAQGFNAIEKMGNIPNVVLAEELFHAYQHDNRNGYAQGEFNREFEAKTFATAFAYEVGKPFSTYNGMEGFLARLKEGKLYGFSYKLLTPKDVRSKRFLFDCFFSAGFYSQYNRINGVGGSSYRERTAVIPYALQKIILDTYNK
jgi:cell well associated rhsD protein